MRKIKWLIAHEPQHLFVRTAEAFAERISAATNGEIAIEIITESEYRKNYRPDFNHAKSIEEVRFNRVEMSQLQLHYLGEYDMNYRAFDMPFLFEDHDHASRVFEGPIGTTMGKRLLNKADVRGLAFTYSGGYRVIGSNEPIMNLTQLAGRRIRVNGNPVNADYMEVLGAQPVSQPGYGYDEIENGDLDAAETTYLRFNGKHILKSEHNLFLTTIIIGKDFWNSLDADTQAKFEQAAREAARLEREWSLQDAENFEKSCVEKGVNIYNISEEDRASMRAAVQPVYDKWTSQFQPGLIDGIRKLAH